MSDMENKMNHETRNGTGGAGGAGGAWRPAPEAAETGVGRRPRRVITPEEGLRNREQLVQAIKEMQRQQRQQRQAYGRRN